MGGRESGVGEVGGRSAQDLQRGGSSGSRAGISFRAGARAATMSGPTAKNTASGDTQAAAEALTLLDALARLPAAAAHWSALRTAWLRLAHPQMRDAVSEATTELLAFPTHAACGSARFGIGPKRKRAATSLIEFYVDYIASSRLPISARLLDTRRPRRAPPRRSRTSAAQLTLTPPRAPPPSA
jgi:hypothetical protein